MFFFSFCPFICNGGPGSLTWLKFSRWHPLGLVFPFTYSLPIILLLVSVWTISMLYGTHWCKRKGGLRASAGEFLWWWPGWEVGAINTHRCDQLWTQGAWVNHILPMLKTFLFSPPGDVWTWEEKKTNWQLGTHSLSSIFAELRMIIE